MGYQLDDIDLNIIDLLQEDARLSNKQLAHKLNRSPNPVYVRVKRLEDEGYILKYTTVIDPKKVERGMTVCTQITLKQHSQAILRAFMDEVKKLPEVMECFHMTGDFDFLLKIVLKDMDAYNRLLIEKLSNLPEVGKLVSSFVMSEVKNTIAFRLTKDLSG